MKSRSSNRLWVKGFILCSVGLAVSTLTFRAQADQWDKKTVITVDQPIQIRDTYLDPGTYVLKLADSSSDRHIVYIFNASQNHLINTVMAVPSYRVRVTGNPEFTFWETPPGTARAMRVWWYPGDNYGQEFPYPKNLRQVAALSPPPPPFAATPAPAPQPQAEPQAVVQEPPARETPPQEAPLVAQNTPPPAAAEPAPAPAPAPQELPKTATPYPLIGLGGLLSLGLYTLVRAKRSA
jgi:hypothetical protein